MANCRICGHYPSYSLKGNDMEYCIFHLPFAKEAGKSFIEELGRELSSRDVKKFFITSFKEKISNFKDGNNTIFSIEGFIFPVMSLSEWSDLWSGLAAEQVNFYSGMIPIKLNAFFNARNTVFHCDVLFKGYFLRGASFNKARFEGSTSFEDVTFKNPKLSYDDNDFVEEPTEFLEAVFSKKAFFLRVHFYDGASFSGAEFCDKTEFFWPRFFGKSDGSLSDEVTTQTLFTRTIFKKHLFFRNPIFAPETECSFLWANFHSMVSVERPAFSKTAVLIFKGATIRDLFKISEARTIYKWNFKERESNIRHLSFIKDTDGSYYEWQTSKDSDCNDIAPHINLQSLTLVENAIVIIDNTYIDNFRFFKTSLISERNKIELPNEPILNQTLFALQDEKDPECIRDKNRYKELERIARELRTALERKGKYIDAGLFFRLEMKYRTPQLNGWKKSIWRIFHKAYSIVDYGESIGKALLWLFVITMLGTIAHLFSGFSVNGEPIEYHLTTASFSADLLGDFFKSLAYTVQNMMFLLSKKFESLSIVGEFINVFLKIISVIMIAILGIAIRRKMRRMMVD